jgi:hypothetical protein
LRSLLNVHRTYISSVELKVSVGIEIANELARALGTRLSDLIRLAEQTVPIELFLRLLPHLCPPPLAGTVILVLAARHRFFRALRDGVRCRSSR